jgi:NAD(P)-dependent dehydrogenase (short-subunit alcohol dehydrogenase family)
MKYYIISGGGSGIGRAIAKKLADVPDNRIIICGRHAHTLSDTRLSLSHFHDHHILPMDITSRDSLDHAVKELPFPHLDGIIANAGVGGENHFGPADRWKLIMETNLTGTYQFVQTFLPWLRKGLDEYRHIVVISSVLARLGVAHYSAYCASKAGLLGLMRSWAVEFAPEQILVNAVCPGWVNTNMARQGMEGIADGLSISREAFYEMAMQKVPLHKMSEPEEIAGLVHFIVNQKSMTGQTIDMNNGAVMNS